MVRNAVVPGLIFSNDEQLKMRSYGWAAMMAIALLPEFAHAWWDADWPYRKRVLLNTSASGAGTAEAVSELPVLVRLHTGNFTFVDANEDGSDLRFVAADDKTPLHHHFEQWDPINELALVWVRVPRLPAASATEHVWLYFGNKKAPREVDPTQRYDAAQRLDLHFNQAQGAPLDYSSYSHPVAAFTASANPQGPIDGAASFAGASEVRFSAAPTLRVNPQAGFTFSTWLRLAGAQGQAALFSQQDGANAIAVNIKGARPMVTIGATSLQGSADLTANAWHHVAVTAGDGKLVLYVDGKSAGESAVALAEQGGDIVIGHGLQGALDEVQVAAIARSPDWIKASWSAQGLEPRLVSLGEEEQSGAGGHSYVRILLGAVTVDGWVVIALLLVMMVISFFVMVGKALFVVRTDKANQNFLERFQEDPVALIDPRYAEGAPAELGASSLFRLYRIGLRELKQRFTLYEQQGQPKILSAQALGAIKASLDAGMVRESARLNSQMVLLTIAISGGPFLGLLGTVVGVMITFAAIAAAGDVNVNSIAPGIAAALVATVAGLGVAIPALFGYNYLASRIRALSNDMTVFADELVTRLAEKYAP
jgi:biopolymer transport protein ExbB